MQIGNVSPSPSTMEDLEKRDVVCKYPNMVWALREMPYETVDMRPRLPRNESALN